VKLSAEHASLLQRISTLAVFQRPYSSKHVCGTAMVSCEWQDLLSVRHIPTLIASCCNVVGIVLTLCLRLWMNCDCRSRNKAQSSKFGAGDVQNAVTPMAGSNLTSLYERSVRDICQVHTTLTMVRMVGRSTLIPRMTADISPKNDLHLHLILLILWRCSLEKDSCGSRVCRMSPISDPERARSPMNRWPMRALSARGKSPSY